MSMNEVEGKVFFVYALKSLNRNYIYVGLTDNIVRRVEQHNKGRSITTKPYKPFKLILVEEFPSQQEARVREKYLKSGVGKALLKALV